MLDLDKFEVFVVGGYVRDRLLSRPIYDHDFVVVGATPEDMLAAKFQQVGADFPVFLSPIGDEFALARTERKTAKGYNGFETDFSPTITLKEDLKRRDLTINAMARKVIGWNELGHAKLSDEIIDPFHGQRDLKKGLIKHVSKAFAEDPLRVLRASRFAARYNFSIDPKTMELMTKLVNDGELDHLVPERVWTEFSKAMSEDHAANFFWAMQECGAHELLFPELGRTMIDTGSSIAKANLHNLSHEEVLAIVFSEISTHAAMTLFTRLRAPVSLMRLSNKLNLLIHTVEQKEMIAEDILDVLNKIDAFGNNCSLESIARIVLMMNEKRRRRCDRILVAARDAKKVTFKSLTKKQQDTLIGPAIKKAIDKLRLTAIEQG